MVNSLKFLIKLMTSFIKITKKSIKEMRPKIMLTDHAIY
jgi:hypothetical protein